MASYDARPLDPGGFVVSLGGPLPPEGADEFPKPRGLGGWIRHFLSQI